jgi:hypothetical protein
MKNFFFILIGLIRETIHRGSNVNWFLMMTMIVLLPNKYWRSGSQKFCYPFCQRQHGDSRKSPLVETP